MKLIPVDPPRPRIALGRIFITPDAKAALQTTGTPVLSLLVRHACGDWGDLSLDDKRQNDLSVATGLRILSVYTLSDRSKVWIITEWDRSSTTVLLPDDH